MVIMRCPREERLELERQMLSPLASHASSSRGREIDEPECEIRTCYQRDVDRITHSKSFRRLKHKTQVFLQPEGDHYRTRLTHTLEVARIARTVARGLRLNEDLTEAIALGHDLGHTPFGHAGERALNELLEDIGGYKHNEQSLRLVEKVERDGQGINLTYEVKNGILRHTGEELPDTPEGCIVRIADRIAYVNHDLDDAMRAGVLREPGIPSEIICAFGAENSDRINTLILDLIKESERCGEITFSPHVSFVFSTFRDFMYKTVYKNMAVKGEERKILGILKGIFGHYSKAPDELPDFYRRVAASDGIERAVSDYISGMTDKYAIHIYERLFIPDAWQVR